MKLVETQNAVGQVLCHDITQIIPGKCKGPVFRKGHIIQPEDIPVLLSVGKEHLYVWENDDTMLHENEAAEILRDICRNEHMRAGEAREGKIELTADADGLFLVNGCADPWNPKTVRATMGACFRLPVYETSGVELAALLEGAGLPLYATALLEDTVDIKTADLSRSAVVIGSEGRGVSRELLELSQKTLKIPMRARCESLNAAAAAAIVLWEMGG